MDKTEQVGGGRQEADYVQPINESREGTRP